MADADDSEQGNAAAVAAFSQVVAYCVTETCRRALVLGHFGEALPWGSCTGCDCCEDPDAVKAQVTPLHLPSLLLVYMPMMYTLAYYSS